MKIAFIGGGSMRTLFVARGAMGLIPKMAGGEISLYDLNVARAEAMGRMLARTPEYARAAPRITWGESLEKSLQGADAVSVTMPAGDPVLYSLSHQVSRRLGFMSSDQLSPTGAFLALQAGPRILRFARTMEKCCPGAMLFIFANPVAVYSGMVNNHTRIKALGICGGYTNHMWDLSRLMGCDRLCNEYDVEVAGVNHLSFIVRGIFQGRDLYQVLGRCLRKPYKPPRLHYSNPAMVNCVNFALHKLVEMYWQFGQIIFSTEGDGMYHLFYEEMFDRDAKGHKPASVAEIRRQVRQWQTARGKQDADFRALVDQDLPAKFWSTAPYARDDEQAAVRILRGLAGQRQKLVASYLNNGAVEGFPDRAVLEYSQTIDRGGIKPYGRLSVHPAFHATIDALAMHQTLLGDAIATEDPRTLFQALFAYPVHQNTKASRKLYKQLIALHKPVISSKFLQASDYF